MCIAKEIFDFALKGVKTFRQASLGNFNEDSDGLWKYWKSYS